MDNELPKDQDGILDQPKASGEGEGKKDSVSYETFNNLLGQRKKDQEKLKELETTLKSFQEKEKKEIEKKLAEEGNFKSILESREKEINELKEKLGTFENKVNEYEQTFVETKKLQALFKEVGGSLKHKSYVNLIDTSKIAVDPNSGEVDAKTLKQYATELMNEHKDLFAFGAGKMPGGAPKGSSFLTYEEWTDLAAKDPKAARERIKDVKR